MKKFENPKEMYLKVVGLQEESCDILQKYIDKEGINSENYIDKLYNDYDKVAEHIFDELLDASVNLDYLLDNSKTHGDNQLITAFVKAYVTDRILDEVIFFEDLVEDENA